MIIIAGENIIDLIASDPGQMIFEGFTGGGPYNVARGVAIMGASSGYLSPISTDGFGDRFEAEMEELGIRILAERSPRPTGLAIVQKDASGHPSYQFHRENAADRDISPNSIRAAIPKNASALYIGGLALAGGEDAKGWAEIVSSLDLPIFADPNIRPGFIEDRAAYLARLDRVYSATSILKLSNEDIAWLAPGTDPRRYMKEIMERHDIGIGCLSEGAKGARLLLADRQDVAVAAPRVDVMDTVGAGDCFCAAILAQMWRAGDYAKLDQDALRYGVAASALSCTIAGANAPKHEAILAFIAEKMDA